MDCGAPARLVEARLQALGFHPGQLAGLLISHAHCDHYASAGTLHKRFGVPVYVDRSTARHLRRKGRSNSWRRIDETRPLPDSIGDLGIVSLDTPHGDPETDGRTVGFRIDHQGRSAAIVTDLGHTPPSLIRGLRGVDSIVLEANYDDDIVRRKMADLTHRREWSNLRWVRGHRGHLSNRQCAHALLEILSGPRAHVLLGHVSENHLDPRRDNNRTDLALREVEQVFRRAGLTLPQIHRTYREGRLGGRSSALIEVTTATTFQQLELGLPG